MDAGLEAELVRGRWWVSLREWPMGAWEYLETIGKRLHHGRGLIYGPAMLEGAAWRGS